MWLQDTLLEAWRILGESAIFILAGFAIAALLHVFLREGRLLQQLRGLGSRSVLFGSIVGLPLPLCSCSVLPAAVALHRKGASKGATLSFLVSTPETSVTSILLTYGLLGPLLAVARPIAAFISAMTAGLLENFVQKRFPQQPAVPETGGPECPKCDTGMPMAMPDEDQKERPSLREGARFAFVEIFDDIIPWLAFGIIFAAVVNILIPPSILQTIFGGPWQSMLIMLVIGVPLYVCAEGSIPIAAAFLANGVNPGAVLVFLLVGPATNIGSVGVLAKELGRRTIVLYLIAISVVALVCGWLLNLIVAGIKVQLAERSLSEPFVPGWLKATGAALFLAMALLSFSRLRYIDRLLAWLDRRLPFAVNRGRAAVTLIVVLVLAWLGSGFVMVQPGEAGFVRRFGRVVRRDLQPGLHYRLPWPIERADRLAIGQVRRLELGYAFVVDPAAAASPLARPPTTDNPAESWILLGDENIVNVKSAVHYGVQPDRAFDYLYANDDVPALVRSATLSALRESLSTRVVDTILTTDRSAAEQTITESIRRRLDACDTGVRCYSFRFLDLHAPEAVHAAFRDVASAMEDKATRINRAETFAAKTIPLARGEAQQRLEDAGGYAHRTVDESVGRGSRFTQLYAEYAKAMDVTRTRLYHEMVDAVLPKLTKYLKPPASASGELEIWFTKTPGRAEALPFVPQSPQQQPNRFGPPPTTGTPPGR